MYRVCQDIRIKFVAILFFAQWKCLWFFCQTLSKFWHTILVHFSSKSRMLNKFLFNFLSRDKRVHIKSSYDYLEYDCKSCVKIWQVRISTSKKTRQRWTAIFLFSRSVKLLSNKEEKTSLELRNISNMFFFANSFDFHCANDYFKSRNKHTDLCIIMFECLSCDNQQNQQFQFQSNCEKSQYSWQVRLRR